MPGPPSFTQASRALDCSPSSQGGAGGVGWHGLPGTRLQIENCILKNANCLCSTSSVAVMYSFPRKTAPKVRNGQVQRKNRWQETPNCYNTEQPVPVIDRQWPGYGFRHL